MGQEQTSVLSKERLTKKELKKIWRRFYWSYGACGGYDRLAGMMYLWGLSPVFDKYYDNDKKCEELLKHSEFYNTENIFGSVICGIVTAMEEQRALGQDVDESLIHTTKLSLMGPMAGIGDALNPGLIVPLLLSIAITFSEGGSPVGAIFYAVAYNVIVVLISRVLFQRGYKMGSDALGILIGEKANRIKDSFILLGTIIMGGVAASYVGLNLAMTIPSGNDQILVQDLLDNVFPKLVPLCIVLGCWAVMSKKHVSAVKMILIMFVCAFIMSFFGII